MLPLAVVAACTFPDPTYSDGDGDAGVTDAEGGVCPELAGCESFAQGCNATAEEKHTSCLHGCNYQEACVTGCNNTLDYTRTGCAQYCEECAGVCGDTTGACQMAAGIDGPF